MQEFFIRISFLVHFDKDRTLFIDLNVSKKRDWNVMIYHVKIDRSHVNNEADFFTSSKRQNVEFIMFLNKILSSTEKRYWFTELKMIVLIWSVRKLRMMIFSAKNFIVVYTNHVVNSVIANQTKLIFNSVNKFNMKLIRAFMYLFQFRLKIYHRFDKFNLIFDALSRLLSTIDKNNIVDSLDIESFHFDIFNSEINHSYVFNQSLIAMSDVFFQKLKVDYLDDKIWFSILKLLEKLKKRIELKKFVASTEESFASNTSTIKSIFSFIASSIIIVLKKFFESIKVIVTSIVFISTIDENLSISKIKKIVTDIDFKLRDDLIYHVKKNIFRLCIFKNCEQKVFKLIHDDCFHAEHHRVYARLIESIYIHKLFKKLTIYIRHCSTCQLNQVKRHRSYDELTSLFILSIFFHTLTMNWVVTLSINKNDFDCTLNVTCKFNRKLQSIQKKIIFFVVKWVTLLINRLQLIDWNISLTIISNRDFKFLSKFWIAFFERLNTNLLFSSTYHSQTNDQSKCINQTFEIVFRYFIIEHSELNWIETLSTLQLIFNNAFNASIDRVSNEIVYEFKIRKIIHVVAISFVAAIVVVSTKNIDSKVKQQLTKIEQTRFRYRIEAADAIFYVSAKFKIMYDFRHVSLLLKSKNKAYFRLHYEYTLSDKLNRKLFNQRCDFFLIQKRVDRLAYQLTLFFQWKIHSIIFVAQLEFYSSENLYQRSKSDYSNEIKIEKLLNTKQKNNYEMKNLINRRQRTFDKITVKQYLVHWKDYESEYDEWKSIIKLIDFLKLVKQYESSHFSKTSIIELKAIKRKSFIALILRQLAIFISKSTSIIDIQVVVLKKFFDMKKQTSARRRDRFRKKIKK